MSGEVDEPVTRSGRRLACVEPRVDRLRAAEQDAGGAAVQVVVRRVTLAPQPAAVRLDADAADPGERVSDDLL